MEKRKLKSMTNWNSSLIFVCTAHKSLKRCLAAKITQLTARQSGSSRRPGGPSTALRCFVSDALCRANHTQQRSCSLIFHTIQALSNYIAHHTVTSGNYLFFKRETQRAPEREPRAALFMCAHQGASPGMQSYLLSLSSMSCPCLYGLGMNYWLLHSLL